MATANLSLPIAPHPYYPLEAKIVGYLANEYGTLDLLLMLGAGVSVILSTAYVLVKRLRPNASTGDLNTMMWFVMCGCIHFFFEGYFAMNFHAMAGKQDLFGQLWKEYSKSDSRYLTEDAFVLCMETITAMLWGPGSFITAYLISIDHPLRYPAQLIVSLGQLYGDVLYYATCMFDHYILDLTYSRPEPAYFYGYFVLMNAFWIVIPGYLIYQSVMASWSAFAAVNDAARLLDRLGKSGQVKKRE